jgi:CRISPR-associated protein Csd2
MAIIQNRYEFVYLFDVTNGNPNGDPDAGNMPRIDPETNHGLVTDVCLKRKIRNYVMFKNDNKPPYRIYIQEKAILNKTHEEAQQAIGATPEPAVTGADEKKEAKGKKKERKGSGDEVEKARAWMCQNFFDVRTFGAVMSTGVNCGQVTGPVQINFARSLDPVTPLEITITRMAVTTEEKAESQKGDNREMGRKHIIPYGLYRAEGYISAKLAEKTGFADQDLALLWESLANMLDHDHSAARGKMSARKLIVFRHESALGNAPAHKLFDLVQIARVGDEEAPARQFGDYQVTLNGKQVTASDHIVCPVPGVTIEVKL